MDLTGSTLQWTFGLLGAAILVIGVWGGVANAPASSSESEHKHA
ncbi:MAG TPA: hypothetical protein VL335_03770 [Candidatus Paceibacterota bacterium]|nr:hypothetical protein [Candidatus Paceibacterota bacterium]